MPVLELLPERHYFVKKTEIASGFHDRIPRLMDEDIYLMRIVRFILVTFRSLLGRERQVFKRACEGAEE